MIRTAVATRALMPASGHHHQAAAAARPTAKTVNQNPKRSVTAA
jgi:hypothetical protein